MSCGFMSFSSYFVFFWCEPGLNQLRSRRISQDFGADVSLKPIERQRVQKWVATSDNS